MWETPLDSLGEVMSSVPDSDEPETPSRMMETARAVASRLVGLPLGPSDAFWTRLKTTNPVMHALVKSCLEDMRRDARGGDGTSEAG